MEEQEKCECGRDLADCECRKPRTYSQEEVHEELLHKLTWVAFGLEDEAATIDELREFIFNEVMCTYMFLPERRKVELPAIAQYAQEVEQEGTHGVPDFPVWLAKMIAARLQPAVN